MDDGRSALYSAESSPDRQPGAKNSGPVQGNTATNGAPAAKLVSLGDCSTLLRIAIALIVVWTVPRSRWRAVSRARATAIEKLRGGRMAAMSDRVRSIVGDRPIAVPPERVPSLFAAAYYESLLLLIAHYRPWPVKVETCLLGSEHIDNALAQGRGAILWNANLVFSSLVQPIALSRAGYRSHHLARRVHGFSTTRLGLRFLNPLQTKIENRYLASRILMSENPLPALVTMQRHLRKNDIVSLTAHVYAHQVLEVPFGDGRFGVATGAIELAQLTGAALLPVLTGLNQAGQYETRILPPLPVSQKDDREAACLKATLQYVRQLESYVLAQPEQWICWFGQARPAEEGEDRGTRRVPGREV